MENQNDIAPDEVIRRRQSMPMNKGQYAHPTVISMHEFPEFTEFSEPLAPARPRVG